MILELSYFVSYGEIDVAVLNCYDNNKQKYKD